MKQSDIIKLALKVLSGYSTKYITIKNGYAIISALYDNIILKIKSEDIPDGKYIIVDRKLEPFNIIDEETFIEDKYNYYIITKFNPKIFKRLKNYITGTSYPVCGKLNFIIYNSNLYVLGSDGCRLMVENLGNNGKLPDKFNQVIQGNRILNILSSLKNIQQLKIYLGKKSLLFEMDEIQIIIRYDNYSYPDILNFITKDIKECYIVEYKSIKQAISAFINYFKIPEVRSKILSKASLICELQVDFKNSKLIFRQDEYILEKPIILTPYKCNSALDIYSYSIIMPLDEEDGNQYINFEYLKDVVLSDKVDFIMGLLDYKEKPYPFVFGWNIVEKKNMSNIKRNIPILLDKLPSFDF